MQQISIGHLGDFLLDFFLSNLDTSDLKTYPITYSGHFWNMSIFRWLKFTLKPPYSIAHDKFDWPFGTLSFGLFCSNLDTRDLETYPRTYSGHFWNMSIFDDFRSVWVLFRKWVVSENQSFLDEGVIIWALIGLVLGGEIPRLNHGPICFQIWNT